MEPYAIAIGSPYDAPSRVGAASHLLRIDMCFGCSQRAGSGSRQMPDSHVMLDTGTLCMLGYYRDIFAVKTWSGLSTLTRIGNKIVLHGGETPIGFEEG